LAYDRVEGICVEIDVLSVYNPRLDVGKTRFPRGIGRQLEHAGRNVGGQHVAGGPNALRRHDGLIPRAGRHVEYPATGLNLGQVKHHLCCRPLELGTPRTPAVPLVGNLLEFPAYTGIFRSA
jgi:hypothetical protein